MEHLTLIVGLLIVWFVLSNLMGLYRMFHAPRCPAGARASQCLSPLFASGESIDLYVYLTVNPRLRWWTSAGLEELLQVPLWNATSVKFGQPVEPVSVEVPLSLAALQGVRRNESSLYAHCFLLRTGSQLQASVRGAVGRQEKAPKRGVISEDALHASAKMTRLLPNTRRKRRNLIEASTAEEQAGEQAEEGAEGAGEGAGRSGEGGPPAVRARLPLLNRTVPVYPDDALMWTGAVFSTTAFLEPSLPAAAVRGSLAAVAAPWLLQLRMQQQERLRALRRQREQELRLWQREPAPLVPHLVPLLRVDLSVDNETYDARYAPPLLYKEMVFEAGSPMPVRERDVRYLLAGGERYVPPLAIDLSGVQQRAWRPLDPNASTADPAIALELDVSGMLRYSLVQTMKQSLEMYMRMGFTERDLEELKDFLFRYPLHIMVLMQVIGFLQVTLTTLAFKNDISFFRGRSDYTGLSSRSLATDTLQEIVIFLYLFDYDDISRIVLFQVGTSAAISAWKYARVARLGLYWSHFLPWISYNRGLGENGEEKGTEDIDARGMKYLKFLLYPLSAAWGIYNLYHNSYKSWWSWLVSSLADFAYTFGFINMMPQIFINYKLKSVAHMPWRVLMYKFFNTFIDDVFAFFIMSDYMTKKHRFMTLRDDVVFFIFLYQRHVYRVDPNRPDEFGFVYADAKATEKAEELVDDSVIKDAPDASTDPVCAGEESSAEPEPTSSQEGPPDDSTAGEGGGMAPVSTPSEEGRADDSGPKERGSEEGELLACKGAESSSAAEGRTGAASGQCVQRTPQQKPVD